MITEPAYPESWEIIKLQEITSSIKGKKPKKLGEKSEKFSIPYIDIKAFEKKIFRKFTDGENTRLCDISDILIVWDGARSGLVGTDVKGAIGSTLAKINNFGLNSKYLFYFLKSKFNYINSNPRGVGIPHIDPNLFWSILIPVAPINEQTRIVSRVEELFSRLDAGVLSLQAAQTQLEQYRQTILKQAYTGKLTEKWRQKRPKKEESYTNQVAKFDAFFSLEDLSNLPDSWKWVFIGNIGEVTGGLVKNSKRKKFELKLPYLRVANVYANELKLDDVKKIGIKESEINRVLLKKGDLLIVEGNGSLNQIGRMAIWDGRIDPCVHQNHIIKVRFDDEALVNFVSHWFLSSEARKFIVEVASSTSGLYTLSLSKVSGLPVPLPSKREQEKIMEIISTNFSIVDKIAEEIRDSRLRVESLRNSVLMKAFEGRLVPQDPNDESAQILLESIKNKKLV